VSVVSEEGEHRTEDTEVTEVWDWNLRPWLRSLPTRPAFDQQPPKCVLLTDTTYAAWSVE
jgi:hypothetical protein